MGTNKTNGAIYLLEYNCFDKVNEGKYAEDDRYYQGRNKCRDCVVRRVAGVQRHLAIFAGNRSSA